MLAQALSQRGINIITGGTDTHLVLLDLSNKNMTGQQAQDILEQVNITSNKNPIPFDSPIPSKWIGLRLGSSAGTTRGLETFQFEMIGAWIAVLFERAIQPGDGQQETIQRIRKQVSELCQKYPIYESH
jgi:glycine hydroxymethyltransferase